MSIVGNNESLRIILLRSPYAKYRTRDQAKTCLGGWWESFHWMVVSDALTTVSTWELQVDDTSSGHKQFITGFGAAVTDATVSVISALVVLSLLRHTIASSDLSGAVYGYSDEIDPDLAIFDLKPEGKDMPPWLLNSWYSTIDFVMGGPLVPSTAAAVQNNFANEVFPTVTFKGRETWSGTVYKEALTTWQLPPTSG
ncbi:hypothetical protein VE03_02055 [Pseudogymnoascus sp. 23342-1-I1]|nr:hypothetical protein VE03_02055 [Pseudogymnoascus sp. 23342-1-I1]